MITDEQPHPDCRAAVLFLLILVLAAALRFHRLDGQSLWDDEVSTIHVASYPVARIWDEIARMDSSPMLFYTLFRPYLLRVPHTESALRIFPAALGLLAVLALYLLARALAGTRAALFAAFLVAVNPFQVYAAQEVRYNSLAVLLVLLSMFFFIRLVERGRLADAAGYAVSTAAAIYTHYFAFFTPLAQLVFAGTLLIDQVRAARRDRERLARLGFVALVSASFLLQTWALVILALYAAAHRRALRRLVLWLLGLVLAAAAFVPFLPVFVHQLLRGVPFREPVPLAEALGRLWVYATIGASPLRLPGLAGLLDAVRDSPRYWWFVLIVLLPLLALVAAGFLARWERPGRRFAALFLAVPLLAALGLTAAMGAFDPRYCLPYYPAVAIPAGASLAALWRRSRAIALAALVYVAGLSGASLADYYFDPAYARQDWRGATRSVQAHLREGDAILFHHRFAALPFEHYAPDAGPRYYLLDFQSAIQASLPERRAALAANMARFLGRYERLWLIDYHGWVIDPEDRARDLLAEAGYAEIERECRYENLFRFCIDLYTRDLAAVRARFAAMIDFRGGDFRPLQLGSGWHHAKDGDLRWMAARAEATVIEPGGASVAVAEFYANYGFLGGRPLEVTLFVDGERIAAVTVDHDGYYTLAAPVASRGSGRERTLVLTSARTFRPADVIGGGDFSEKSLLVARIGLEAR